MELLNIFSQNLITPAILFFVLGIIAGCIRSDLEIPNSISRYLSIYLMMAIGFKGGVAIANTTHLDTQLVLLVAAGLCVSFLQPFIAYYILRVTSNLDKATAAATAAHYGSISMVTFATASAFLKSQDVTYAAYIVAIVALMEGPAILSGLFIAHRTEPQTNTHVAEQKRLTRDIFTNGAILLLMGAFLIGWITGERGMEKMDAFLIKPFDGILALFLLDMGILVAKNINHLKSFTWPLALFGINMPLIGCAIGLGLSKLIGLDVGTGMLFTVLCASASYIAVPAAMRLALPEAKAAIYIPMSLGITFPFNVVVGIPLYYALAKVFLKAAQ
ncbi:MAG: sodium-dependent bicarbonate transport family permease [Alphaproteobacteria bacterium]|nr:sodium-dependent bicarbonate transport family permease [Alphaproteobacteria bacterium]